MNILRFAVLALAVASATLAQQPTPAKPQPTPPQGSGTGARWFPAMEKTIETKPTEGESTGTFEFQNPTDLPYEWRDLVGSCTCSSCVVRVGDRRYEMKPKPKELVQIVAGEGGEQRVPVTAIPIGPNEHGELDVNIHTSGLGSKSVTVDVHTTDPNTPMIRLTLTANGQRAVVVEPAEVDLQAMAPGDKKDFTVLVTSPVQPQFTMEMTGKLPPGITAEIDKADRGEATVWTIHGHFEAKNNNNGGVLTFATNIQYAKSISLRVHADVRVPVEVTPGFVAFGQIHKGQKVTQEVRIKPNDGTHPKALAVRLERLSVADKFVQATPRQDGDTIVIDLEIAADAPNGLIRGNLVVDLDHPTVKQMQVLFNGFVR